MVQKREEQSTPFSSNIPRQQNWVARLYLWCCERLYHELAWSYDLVSWLVSFGHWNRWRSAALESLCDEGGKIDQHVLEIGFGTGELLLQLCQAAAAGGRVVGLELSPAMHTVTAAKVRRRRLPVSRVLAPAQQMPFEDASFDTVVSTFPAPYIFETQTLQECARVLRSGPSTGGQATGQLLIVGTWVSFNARWLERLGLPFYGRPGAAWYGEVEERLMQAGFTVTFKEVHHGAVWVSVIQGRQ